jgi:hypothetical protein
MTAEDRTGPGRHRGGESLSFTAEGLLPPGDYEMTLDEIEVSLLVCGPRANRSPDWDEAWRHRLVTNLRVVVGQLRGVGIGEVYVDGSFAEDKDHPNDIDGYFTCDPARFASGSLEHDLNRVDPRKSWTWDHRARRRYRGYAKLQLPMWHAYRIELYPHFRGLIAGQDEYGNDLEFPAFFRKRRSDSRPRGIVKIVQEP